MKIPPKDGMDKYSFQVNFKATKYITLHITSEGWQETPLIKSVEMILLGSVVQDGSEMFIETKVYTSAGNLILSQVNTAKREKDIRKIAKKL